MTRRGALLLLLAGFVALVAAPDLAPAGAAGCEGPVSEDPTPSLVDGWLSEALYDDSSVGSRYFETALRGQ